MKRIARSFRKTTYLIAVIALLISVMMLPASAEISLQAEYLTDIEEQIKDVLS